MAKGVYANSGLCLTCRRYSPKSLSNCKIVQDALEECDFYLEREDAPKKPSKKKRTRKKKQETKAPFITDEGTTINAILKR